ncbi:Hypothetical predicted protein [Mytilus galloprovincialis]|uniref:Uncharacterized protein n=1 Tax=Mytilus galloprovincialis TaxID=29158 RepID=A0A8B6G5D3_MYTGA|nr:Hypothetical predicted protein [Mytilus galloprovincialis]
MSKESLYMDDLLLDNKGNDNQPTRKVDKLGRVRPRSYCHKKNPPKKAKKVESAEENVDVPELVTELDQSTINLFVDHFKTSDSTLDTIVNEKEENDDSEIIDTIRSLIEGATFQNKDQSNADAGDFISDEKWHELMDHPEITADDADNFFDTAESKNENVDNCYDFEQNSTIYPGHHMTIYTSMVLILLYSMCHSISGAQLNDLLTIIGLHCMHSHDGLKSMYTFKRFFTDLQSPMKKHYYCSTCFGDINFDADVCPNENCQHQLNQKKKSYFIEIPVKHQIKTFMEKEGTVEILNQRFKRKKRKNILGIEDIYDGKLYSDLSKLGGPLSAKYPNNISLTWNTDGIPIFLKAQKFQYGPCISL